MHLQCAAVSAYAADLLNRVELLEVQARFRRVINLAGGGGVVSVQEATVPCTPLSLVLEPLPFAQLCRAGGEEAVVRVRGGTLLWGGLSIHTDGLAPFSCAIAPAGTGAVEEQVLRRLRGAAALLAKPDSLVFAAAPVLAEPAGVSLTALHRRAAAELEAGRPWALVGLGGGLTPGGDDFLIGALAALTWLGAEGKCTALANQLAPRLEQTTSISRAFLERAMAGEFSQPVTVLFEALGKREKQPLIQAAGRLCAIGHTSGSDLLGGVLWTLEGNLKWEGTA